MTDAIFVPGLPATELFKIGPLGGRSKIYPVVRNQLLGIVDPATLGPDDLLNDSDPVEAGDPIDRVRVLIVDTKQARSLYDILRGPCQLADDQIHKAGWDWRRPVDDLRARALVEKAILGAPQGSVLVLHSTGGLVAKSVLSANPALCDRLSAVVAFGVPWIGTLKPMAALRLHVDPLMASPADARRIMAHSWAAIDLLPRADAGLTVSGNGQPFDLFASANWLPPAPAFLRPAVKARLDRSLASLGTLDPQWDLPVPLHNVAGFGAMTTVSARVVGGGATVQFDVDGGGNPLSFEQRCEGDGTVPFRSASAATGPQVNHWRVPVGAYRKMGRNKHRSLWSNPACVRLLQTLVAGTQPQPWIELALDTSLYSPGEPVRLRYSLFDADGTPSPNGKLRIVSASAPGPVPEVSTDLRGWGVRELPRSDFRALAGQNPRRRVVVEVESDRGRSDVFAIIPRN